MKYLRIYIIMIIIYIIGFNICQKCDNIGCLNFENHEINCFEKIDILHSNIRSRDIWTDYFENQNLIDEMNNIRISNNNIELIKSDFLINNTSDFENGSKSSSLGNFQIETKIDNPGILQNQLELCSGKGDSFTINDIDGDTWKWDCKDTINPGGSVGSFNKDISNNKLNLAINNGELVTCGAVSNFKLDKNKDIEIKIKIDISSQNSHSYHTLGLWDTNDLKQFSSNPNGIKVTYKGDGAISTQIFQSGVKTTVPSKSIGTKNVIYLKIKFNYNLNDMSSYYSTDNIVWQKHTDTQNITFQYNPYVSIILTQGGSKKTVTSEYDDYELINGELINGYRPSGSWESALIEFDSDYSMCSTNLEFSDVIKDKSEIDKIEWLENNVVKAAYETDIENPTDSPFTIRDADLSSGTFKDIEKNFTIKLYLTGDGEHTPVVSKITNEFRCLNGHLISTPIDLPNNYKWDTMTATKSTTTDTEIKLSVLDGLTDEKIPGFENLTVTNINLSNIDSKIHSVIKLRADFCGSATYSPKLQEWSVSWKEDYPVLDPEIPSDYKLLEDSKVDHLIDLGEYFHDYYDSIENLSFLITKQTNKKHLLATLDARYLNFETKQEHWTGSESFIIECMDSGGLKIESNKFEVSVTPVDDPPVWIKELPTLKMDEDTKKEDWLDLDEYVSDIEEDYLDFKVVNHSNPDNITIILNSENKVTVTSAPNYSGTVSITMQVFEGENESLYANDTFDIIVYPINDPPMVFPPVDDKMMYEDEWLNFTISAFDLDTDDVIKFYSNITKNNFKLNKETGNLSFHPTNADVGMLYVNITVEDAALTKGHDHFNITIVNVNDPPDDPVISSPENEAKFKIDEAISFAADEVSDIDLGDMINYSWDFDLSNGIKTERVGKEVNYSYKTSGRYIVTLTITDGAIEKTTSIVVNITKSEPSKPDDPTDDPLDIVNDREFHLNDWLIYILLIIVIIIILIIVIFLVFRGRKKSKVKEIEKEIDQAYDWARTNPTIGKERLSNIKMRLSNDLKNGMLTTQEYDQLEYKLNDYLKLLGTRAAPGQIPTATPLKPETKPIVEEKPKVTVTPVQPKPTLQQTRVPSPQPTQTQPQSAPAGKKEVVKCFKCGNLVTVTKAPEGEPTILHCTECGSEGTI